MLLEIDYVTKTFFIKGYTSALAVSTERFTLYLTMITYVLLGNRLTGEVVFSMAQLFNSVQLYMTIFFPLAVSTYAEAKVTIKRLEEFLLLEENKSISTSTNDDIVETNNRGKIKIINANASWLPNPIVDTLKKHKFGNRGWYIVLYCRRRGIW
ncbi:hypothetical protein NQ314_006455 [Rhamnusium bicolor]|uniref:ABC transmembrane type-1 domain-containing protein n=1 Tax=Rhamnusium bicolor TaxID=1586634 RepID=A0AAV8Z3Z8_9CUCU|nr:hypothetical protein NQ314_006455 [Rhamnusium bicolor]